MSQKVTWSTHAFDVLNYNANWSNHAGIYIFCGVTSENYWRAYYIGQAVSFANRIPNHERWAEAVRAGATHVHAMVVQQAASRDAIEQELIRLCRPQLNTHHV
jgi:hypothetical protein